MSEGITTVSITVEMVLVWLIVVTTMNLVVILVFWAMLGHLKRHLYGHVGPRNFLHEGCEAPLQELAWSNREDLEKFRTRLKQVERSCLRCPYSS